MSILIIILINILLSNFIILKYYKIGINKRLREVVYLFYNNLDKNVYINIFNNKYTSIDLDILESHVNMINDKILYNYLINTINEARKT